MASQINLLVTCGESRTANAIAFLLTDRPDLRERVAGLKVTYPAGLGDPALASKGVEIVNLPSDDLAACDLRTVSQLYTGVDVVIMIPPASGNKVEQARASITAANMAGVKNIILVSSQGCTAGTPKLGEFLTIEQEAQTMMPNANICILRSGHYMQNLFLYADQIREHKFLGIPIGDGKFAPVDARDLAMCAVLVAVSGDKTAISSEHRHSCYTITGLELVNGDELMQTAQRRLARVGLEGVGFRDISKDEWARYINTHGSSVDKSEVGVLEEQFSLIRRGLMAEVSRDVKKIAPEENATTVDEFFEEYADLFAEMEE